MANNLEGKSSSQEYSIRERAALGERNFYAAIFNMADVQATVDIISALKIRELDSGLNIFLYSDILVYLET